MNFRPEVYNSLLAYYLAFSYLVCFLVIFRDHSKNKLIDYFLLTWIMTAPVINSSQFKVINPVSRYFRGRPDLYYITFFSVIIILKILTDRKSFRFRIKDRKMLTYEKFLFAFIILDSSSLFIHNFYFETVEVGEMKRLLLMNFIAIVVFFYVYVNMTKELLKSMTRIIILMSVVSSLVAIIQFFYDPHMFKTGGYARAFAGLFRASGLFNTGFDHGLFISLGFYLVLFSHKKKSIKYLYSILFSMGVFLIFSRGVLMAIGFSLTLHLILIQKKQIKRVIFLGSAVLFILFFSTGGERFTENLMESDMVQERMAEDTASIRFGYYTFILKAIPAKWWIGYGSRYNNDVYYQGMINLNQGYLWAVGKKGGIHNLYLEVAFLRGLIILFFLLGTFYMFYKYSLKRTKDTRKLLYLSFAYYVTAFAIYKLTTASYLLNHSGLLTMVMFGAQSALYHKDINVDELSLEMKDE